MKLAFVILCLLGAAGANPVSGCKMINNYPNTNQSGSEQNTTEKMTTRITLTDFAHGYDGDRIELCKYSQSAFMFEVIPIFTDVNMLWGFVFFLSHRPPRCLHLLKKPLP